MWSTRVAVVPSLAYVFGLTVTPVGLAVTLVGFTVPLVGSAVPLVGLAVSLIGLVATLIGLVATLIGLVVTLVGFAVTLVGFAVTLVGGPDTFSSHIVTAARDCLASRPGGEPLPGVLGASSAGLVAVGRANAALAL